MFQGNYKKFTCTHNIPLMVGSTVTNELCWKAGETYQSFFWESRLFGRELHMETETRGIAHSSNISDGFLEDNGFIEAE